MQREHFADEFPADDRPAESHREERAWTFTLCALCAVPSFLVGLALGAFAVGHPSTLFHSPATHTHGADVPPEARPLTTSPTADKTGDPFNPPRRKAD